MAVKNYKVVSFMPYPAEAQNPWLLKYVNPEAIEIIAGDPSLSEDQVCELVSDCNMIIATPTTPYLNKKILESAQKLELVQFASVGYDRIDLESADKLGIPVANNAGLNAVTVAEHAMMMILVLQRRGVVLHQEVMDGIWPEITPGDMWELRGRTLGILGLGAIGTELAKISRGFGVKILYNKRNRLSEKAEREQGVEYRAFDDLIKESDILSIHVPLNDETRHIIGEREINMMKNGAILVNTARKDVIDEEAAALALRDGKLYGVGIDVPKTCEDRAQELCALFRAQNAIITSHTASSSYQIMSRFSDRLSQFVQRSVEGAPPLYPVNEVGKNLTKQTDESGPARHRIEQAVASAGLFKEAVSKFFKKSE